MTDDGKAETASFSFDPGEEHEPVGTIVRAVAWANGVDVDDLEPLRNVIDVEALIDLLTHEGPPPYRSATAADSANVEVTFGYEGCTVSVTEGHVRIDRS